MQLRLRTRPTRRCTLLMITWSCVAVVLLYLRANRDSNRPMMADISLSADLMNSYFHWPILDLVQRARIFPDGKQFVDMVLKHPLDEVIKDFQLRGLNNKSNKDDIAKFIEDNYLPAGSDVKAMVPSDWHPDAVNKLAESLAKEPGMSEWVHGIHKLWRSLARRPVQNAIPHLSSLIIPSGTDSNWFIVPGGRFREMFYWDTYWTMQGLAVSGMHLTMHSMLSTMLAFVAQLGYVPNCNRVYCLNRSQPPMLCLMVEAYLKATDDQAFLRENFHLLEREYDWWMSERTATVVIDFKYSYALNHYGTSGEVNKPRPESYREDFETASHSADVQRVYSELAAACESGQDFSSRWMAVPADLASVETSRILPVDLNAILHKNERLLSEWAAKLGLKAKAHLYSDSADMRLQAIRTVLWNNTAGCWFDWHLDKQAPVGTRFYASNLVPVFTGSVHSPEATLPRLLNYIDQSGALAFPAGVPFSLSNQSRQQWDFPNVWPPYQHMLATGLANSDNRRAQLLAKQIATNWLRANLAAWQRDGGMHEKADCRSAGGTAGTGGEYASQLGFGWTNGAALDLLAQGLLLPARAQS